MKGDQPQAGARRRSASLAKRAGVCAALLMAALCPLRALAETHTLESLSYSTLPGERVQITFGFQGTPPEPLAFTIDDPARIVLDFAATSSALEWRSKDINAGALRSVNVAQARDRSRAVLNLAEVVSYKTEVNANQLLLTLAGARGQAVFNGSQDGASSGQASITDIDFRRGEDGEGRVLIRLSSPSVPIDVREQGGRIIVELSDTQLPKDLERRLDVLDFATPVKTIDTTDAGDDVRMVIRPQGNYEHLAYQSGNLFTVEVAEVSQAEEEQRKRQQFTGQKLSLNFQDIEVRSVLQLLADFTGLNIVVSDSVGGNLTLRLKNVPWDQALDIILKTQGLAKRQTGNVILIAPSEEIAAREKLELEARQQVRDLAPLRSEFLQINYARASELAALLKAPESSLLSGRGNVSIDQRTNTLLVQDTAAKLDEIRSLVKRLDIPVRQVLIESRIVIASNNFSKELGVRFGVSNFDNDGPDAQDATSGSLNGTTQLINGDDLELDDRLNVNLPAVDPAGSLGLALAKLPLGLLLELELSAAQAESRAEIVSTPRVITSNQNQARIEQGVEVPFQEASSSGATSVSFKKAVLSLEVTPQITPDDRIAMELNVNSDSVGEIFAGVPSIDTREVQTRVLVDNGQTVVLGGVYEQNSNISNRRVPFFSDIPLLGRLFRNDTNSLDKAELLIFVTPKIISEDLTLPKS